MKNFFLLAVGAAAAFYAYTSWSPSTERVASEQAAGTRSYGGNPVREIQRAPQALIDMQGAMGNSNASTARAARKAVQDQVGQ